MDEIRKNHIVQIITKDNVKLDGIVFDYTFDRVSILIAFESLLLARKIEELDELTIIANTHLGIKKMICHVIDKLNANNCIIVENNKSLPVEQKREFVRVLSNAVFDVIKEDSSKITAYCINISAGGVAFCVNNSSFKQEENIKIILSKEDFEKEIIANAQIIKIYDNCYVAKFLNLNTFDEDKIVKYVFKLIAKK